jgi:hypothetical protein
VGAAVVANKLRGIRAGVCHDTYSAHQAVEHDDVNVLCLGARVIGPDLARSLVETFLAATFSGEERHMRRLAKIDAIESRFLRDDLRPRPYHLPWTPTTRDRVRLPSSSAPGGGGCLSTGCIRQSAGLGPCHRRVRRAAEFGTRVASPAAEFRAVMARVGRFARRWPAASQKAGSRAARPARGV